MIARPGQSANSGRVRSWPIIGCTDDTPINDSNVGGISIWLATGSYTAGSMPPPKTSAGM